MIKLQQCLVDSSVGQNWEGGISGLRGRGAGPYGPYPGAYRPSPPPWDSSHRTARAGHTEIAAGAAVPTVAHTLIEAAASLAVAPHAGCIAGVGAKRTATWNSDRDAVRERGKSENDNFFA